MPRGQGHVDALNNLGVIHLRNGNYPAARGRFEKAVRLRPVNVDGHYNLACLYAAQGEVALALAHLKRAVSMDRSVTEWARVDRDLAALRTVSEFKEIIGRGEE